MLIPPYSVNSHSFVGAGSLIPIQRYLDQQAPLNSEVSTKFFCSSFFVSKKLEALKPAHSGKHILLAD
jgi:hypothetical protein